MCTKLIVDLITIRSSTKATTLLSRFGLAASKVTRDEGLHNVIDTKSPSANSFMSAVY